MLNSGLSLESYVVLVSYVLCFLGYFYASPAIVHLCPEVRFRRQSCAWDFN